MGRKASKIYSCLVGLISVVFLPDLVAAMPQAANPTIAQQPETPSQEADRAAAERAEAEAGKLLQQGVPKRQAIAKYEEARKLWHSAGDLKKEANLLQAIASIYNYSLGEFEKSLGYYNQALAIYQTLGNRDAQGVTLSAIGGIYKDLGEYQKARDAYNQALRLFEGQADPFFQATALDLITSVYQELGETQNVFATLNQALKLWQAKGDRPNQAEVLGSLATQYAALGELRKAQDYLKQAKAADPNFEIEKSPAYVAISAFTGAGKSGGTAAPAQDYLSLESLENAPDQLNQMLAKARANEERILEAQYLILAGSIFRNLGEYQQAIDFFNQGLSLWRGMGNRAQEAKVLIDIAGLLNEKGEKQQAIDAYNQALAIQRQIGNRPGEAATLKDLAEAYQSLGAYPLSIDAATRALSLFREIGNRQEEGSTLNKLASIYRRSGDSDQAIAYAQQALAVHRAAGNRMGEVEALSTLARAYTDSGGHKQALEAAEKMLSASRQAKFEAGEMGAIGLMGRIYIKMGNYEKALESTEQALSLSRQIEFRVGEASALNNLGEIYAALNQPEKAIAAYQGALSLSRTLGLRGDEADALYQMAKVERKRDNLSAALTEIDAAIAIIEEIRTKVASADLRISFFASKQDYYQLKIDILMQLHKQRPSQGYDALALQASESARARTLLEILTEAHVDIRQGVEPKLLEEERTLQSKLDALEKRRIELLSGNFTPEQAAALEKENEALVAQYQKIQAQIRATSPRYANLKYPQPLTLAEIQQRVLDDNTLLLEYSLGEERSYLWAVTKAGMTSYELPKRADIEAKANRFRNPLTVEPSEPSGQSRRAPSGIALSKVLLEPIATQLGQKRLAIVSDGALQYISFAALPDPTSSENQPPPLIVNHEIVSLPSASTLAVLRQELKGRKPAPKTVAIFADPVFSQDDERVEKTAIPQKKPSGSLSLSQQALDRSARESGITFQRLPGTRQEAEQILQLVPANKRLQEFDVKANLATATSPQLSQYRIVHFATHGILNTVNPELSGIVLSLVDEKGMPQNGFLRLHEIFNLNLPAELVVLSACKTGLGQEVRGEGLVGLMRGFMYAGAARVVVSLWSVSDEATALLMTKFYSGMLQKGLLPTAALRAAQLEMQQDPQWQNPYYWAAFTLQGEWN